MADPAFSLPFALAIAALGGGVTLWALYRSVIDRRHAQNFRQKSIDAAPERATELEALFAVELELARVCAALKGQDWVVGRRIIHAAEVVVHAGLNTPAESRDRLEQALTDCHAGDLEEAWGKLTVW